MTFHGWEGLTAGLVFDWSGWLMMVGFVIWALYREQQWIVTQLKEEVSTRIITPAQYRTACSAWLQTYSRTNALFSGKYHLVNRFYTLTGELAYKKQQSSLPDEKHRDQFEIDEIRAELGKMSSEFIS